MYELEVEDELRRWRKKLTKRDSALRGKASEWQERLNAKLPSVYHGVATACVKKTAEMIILGAGIAAKKPEELAFSLQERDEKAKKVFTVYRRTAVAGGIGTGAGGVVAGLADFPLLFALKIKALFDVAAIYGYSTDELQERQHLLLIFQLAFSTGEMKQLLLREMDSFSNVEAYVVDWKMLQMHYRDYIDLPKTLQLIPGFGAFFGGFANRMLFNKLEETTINAFRLRWLNELKKANNETYSKEKP